MANFSFSTWGFLALALFWVSAWWLMARAKTM
jgi:hypothetical protein